MIKICSSIGFCFGVKRAVEKAENIKKENPTLNCYTFGSLVHNEKVVKSLEEKGIICINNLDEAENGFLIIRSHGVNPKIIDEAKSRGFEVIDSTCPFVKKIHNIVNNLREKKIPVVIIGKEEHPEIQGIIGYAGDNCFVINSVDEVDNLPILNEAGVVVQTTKIKSEYISIVTELVNKIRVLHIYNTICSETIKRQLDSYNLAKESDIVFVVGGKHSSNTAKLFEISKKVCSKTYKIEDSSELDVNVLQNIKKDSVIGLISGASTPIEEIFDIRDKINKHITKNMQKY